VRVGVDIGGTKVLGVTLDDDGTVVASAQRPTPAVSDLITSIAEVIHELGATGLPIGIGAPGLVTADGVLLTAPNIAGVQELHLRELVSDRLGVSCVLDNDNTCATLAEWRLGAARGYRDALYVGLGTGIGGGVVLGGVVQRGAHRFAGEFGHMIVDPDGPLCGCGRYGCWERYASGSGLAALATRRGLVAHGGLDVVVAHRAGNPTAALVIEEFTRWVAQGLVNLVNAFDPAVVVLGGGVMDAATELLEPIDRWFAELLFGHALRTPPQLRSARFGGRASVVGAALLID
jgi:glucokinase